MNTNSEIYNLIFIPNNGTVQYIESNKPYGVLYDLRKEYSNLKCFRLGLLRIVPTQPKKKAIKPREIDNFTNYLINN